MKRRIAMCLSIKSLFGLLACVAISESASSVRRSPRWEQIGVSVYAKRNCDEDNLSSRWVVPSNGTCTQLIPGNFQFYTQFIASSEEDDPTGSFQYYNDLNCTEREYAFSGVYIETITTGRETCNNDANGEVSMLIKEANEKKPTALHKTISVVVYPDRNCPFNVVASESLVPSDGSCGPWTGKQSSKFIRESSDSTVGDIVVYKDDDCAIVDEYLSANLEEIDAGLDQGPSCRNSDRVDSYGISFP